MIVLNLTRRTKRCEVATKPIKPAKVIIRRKNDAPGLARLNAGEQVGVEVKGSNETARV